MRPPYDSERRTAILVRQFRAPVFFAARSEETLEAIAGIVEGIDPMECAQREAFEEAGLKLAKLEHVVTGWTMPGVSTERMEFYLAIYRAADRIAPGGGLAGDDERISVVEMELERLAERPRCAFATRRAPRSSGSAESQTWRESKSGCHEFPICVQSRP